MGRCAFSVGPVNLYIFVAKVKDRQVDQQVLKDMGPLDNGVVYFGHTTTLKFNRYQPVGRWIFGNEQQPRGLLIQAMAYLCVGVVVLCQPQHTGFRPLPLVKRRQERGLIDDNKMVIFVDDQFSELREFGGAAVVDFHARKITHSPRQTESPVSAARLLMSSKF